MDAIEKLLAVEGVRRAKAIYWHAMDMKDWDRLASIFTADCIFDMRGERAYALGEDVAALPPVEEAIAAGDSAVTVGSVAIAAFVRGAVETWVTIHHGHEPVIDVLSSDSAEAIWPLFDFIDDGRNALKGYSHYHDRYRRETDGVWRISYSSLTRVRTEGVHPWSAT